MNERRPDIDVHVAKRQRADRMSKRKGRDVSKSGQSYLIVEFLRSHPHTRITLEHPTSFNMPTETSPV